MSFFAVAGGRKVKERKATTLSLSATAAKRPEVMMMMMDGRKPKTKFFAIVYLFLYIYICVWRLWWFLYKQREKQSINCTTVKERFEDMSGNEKRELFSFFLHMLFTQ